MTTAPVLDALPYLIFLLSLSIAFLALRVETLLAEIKSLKKQNFKDERVLVWMPALPPIKPMSEFYKTYGIQSKAA